ncbi:hypothetical protein AMTRI_Chr05g69380 [Amborella trichopoda]
MAGRERVRERLRLLQEGLVFAWKAKDEEEEEEDDERRIEIDGELGALLQELSHLQSRMAVLMEKIGTLPLEIIRDMREEVLEVTDQLRFLHGFYWNYGVVCHVI